MKIFFLIIFGLILSSNAFSKTKFSEVKKALKEDGYGKAIPEKFHHLNSPKAINPVSVSDFSIIGRTGTTMSVAVLQSCGWALRQPHWQTFTALFKS